MSSNEIKMQLETYDKTVNSIEASKDIIIGKGEGYVPPDAVCLLNDVIPDYEGADHEIEDMLRKFKKETELLIDTMRKIRNEYKEQDTSNSEDGQKIY